MFCIPGTLNQCSFLALNTELDRTRYCVQNSNRRSFMGHCEPVVPSRSILSARLHGCVSQPKRNANDLMFLLKSTHHQKAQRGFLEAKVPFFCNSLLNHKRCAETSSNLKRHNNVLQPIASQMNVQCCLYSNDTLKDFKAQYQEITEEHPYYPETLAKMFSDNRGLALSSRYRVQLLTTQQHLNCVSFVVITKLNHLLVTFHFTNIDATGQCVSKHLKFIE